MNIEYIGIRHIKPYKKNAKKHDQRQIDNVAESIKQFGFAQPLVIDKDGILIIGHCRLEAAKKLDIAEVPCVRMDQLTEEQVKKLRLLDNKLNESEWDMSLVLPELDGLDMSGFDIDWGTEEETSQEEGEAEEDNFEPQPRAIPNIQRGDVILLGRHKLLCGDSTKAEDIDRLMAGVEADLYITDPPYNVGLGQENGHALRPSEAKQLHRRTDGLVIDNDAFENEEEFISFLEKCYNNTMPHLKAGAPFYIWYADSHAYSFLKASEKAKMTIRQNLIWVKSSFAFGRQDYQWRHESCLYGWKDGAGHYFVDDRSLSTVYDDNADIDKMTKSEMQAMLHELLEKKATDVLYEAKPNYNDLHPTMKPVKLIGRLIRNSSKPDDIVLDTFGGSGTTLIACEQLGRTCHIVEYDPSYAECIIDRYVKLTGDKDGVCIMRGDENLTYDEIKTATSEE